MATRETDVFQNFAFFPKPQPDFSKTPLSFYLSNMPFFPDMLSELNKEGLFLGKEYCSYKMEDFLKTYFKDSKSALEETPLSLLTKPLKQPPIASELSFALCPKPFLKLLPPISLYIEMICDVLNNELAQKPYEKLADREYVTEKVHALQAGKISYHLNMTAEDVLALLFHDIARPSINDPEHGHSKHAQEGSTILAPLGLSTDYAGHHTFAKFLLFKFCPQYKHLISATSQHTLKIQSKDLGSQLGELNEFTSPKLAFELYKIMFMRLMVDDMSKIPFSSELSVEEAPEYFNNERIKTMLNQQITTHLLSMLNHSTSLPETIFAFERKLTSAISLLQRAEKYSFNPGLYVEQQEYLTLSSL